VLLKNAQRPPTLISPEEVTLIALEGCLMPYLASAVNGLAARHILRSEGEYLPCGSTVHSIAATVVADA
jgi:hypothetical protein